MSISDRQARLHSLAAALTLNQEPVFRAAADLLDLVAVQDCVTIKQVLGIGREHDLQDKEAVNAMKHVALSSMVNLRCYHAVWYTVAGELSVLTQDIAETHLLRLALDPFAKQPHSIPVWAHCEDDVQALWQRDKSPFLRTRPVESVPA